MIKGYAQRRLDRLAWEVALINEDRSRSYTLEFKVHAIEKEGDQIETSMFSLMPEQTEILRAFASALQQMEIMPLDATAAELKATKYHLEDMRRLAQANITRGSDEG